MRHAQWFASHFQRRFGHRTGPRCGPIGLEFRDGFVRIVQVARDRRAQVLAAACVAYDTASPDRSIEQVAHALAGGGFRGRECVVVLPFEAARVQTMTVEDGDDDAIKGDIARTLDAADRRGSASADPAQREIGFLRLGPIGHARCEVAAVVASRPLIEGIAHPLIDAGFWPSAVEPSFTSVARACSRTHRRAADRGRVRLAVDLHRAGATALLLQGQTIVYAHSVDDRERTVEALDLCWSEARRVFGQTSPTEVRVVGTDAYDFVTRASIESACGLPVHYDDELGTFAAAYTQIGVHAVDSMPRARGELAEIGGAAAWVGAFGAAFRGVSRAAMREREEAPNAQQRREAA
jgi:hypothetical protein